jgi:hypothetical protein
MTDHDPQPTHPANAAPAPAAGAEKSAAAARRRAGNSSGGKHQRQVAVIGLGDALPVAHLRTAEDHLAVLEAVLSAVARGKTSGLVAQTIIATVKAASQILAQDQAAQIQELTRRVEDLLGGNVVTVRR